MLRKQINLDLAEAMKDKNQPKVDALRLIKSAIQLEETSGKSHELEDSEVIKIIQKLSKQKEETANMYISGGRDKAAQLEISQKAYIDYYLPKMLDEGQLRVIIDDIISKGGYSSIRDMKSIMSALAENYAGQYDSKAVGPIVKSLL